MDDMLAHFSLVESRKSDECGCPEEEWVIGLINVIIHVEPNDDSHIFIDTGDWDDERLVSINGIEDLRKKAVEWIASIPVRD